MPKSSNSVPVHDVEDEAPLVLGSRVGLERARAHGRARGESNAVTRLDSTSCPPKRLRRFVRDLGARDANVPQIAVRHLRQLRATAGAAKPLGGEMLHSGHKK